MIVIEWISSEGRQIEEAANKETAQRREIELRTRGARYVVWYEMGEGPTEDCEAARTAANDAHDASSHGGTAA